jgi:hypothetical protein
MEQTTSSEGGGVKIDCIHCGKSSAVPNSEVLRVAGAILRRSAPDPKRKTKTCKYCKGKFKGTVEYLAHKVDCPQRPTDLKHHGRQPIPRTCEYCGEKFKANVLLRAHEPTCPKKQKHHEKIDSFVTVPLPKAS